MQRQGVYRPKRLGSFWTEAAEIVWATTIALLLALSFAGWRLVRRRRLARKRRMLPGGSPETAKKVSGFKEIDAEIERRRCSCGGRLKSLGEGTAGDEERRVRLVRVECDRCEEQGYLYFDVTSAYH